MAITLIKGRPGAGKSYECVVHHILPTLRDGRKVVTNIPVNIERFVTILGDQVRDLIEVHPFDFDSKEHFLGDPEEYIAYQDWRNDKGQGCLFVLDECHFLFPAQGRGKQHAEKAQKQIQFFSGHRHYGFDFIFMTQADRKINRTIREDIEICIELRKNRAIGDKSYRRYVYYYGEGKRSGLIEQSSRNYEDKFFGLYKSHTKSEISVSEASVKDLKKWHQSWGLRLAFLLIILGVFWSVSNVLNLFQSKEDEPKADDFIPFSAQASILSSHDTHPVYSQSSAPSLKPSEVPFGKFEVFIDGYSQHSYTDKHGLLKIDKSVTFIAVNKAQYELRLHLEDFYLAGYDITIFGRCFVKLTYQDFERLVYCKGRKPNDSHPSKDITNLATFN